MASCKATEPLALRSEKRVIRKLYIILVLAAIVTQDRLIMQGLLLLSVYLVWHKPMKLTRYQRLRVNGGSHTDLEWRLLKFYYGNRCVYCRRRNVKLTKDHIVPVSRGGKDTIRNIVPACQACNSRKSNKIVSL